jgi:membrane-bound lytic murein transglycosylase D
MALYPLLFLRFCHFLRKIAGFLYRAMRIATLLAMFFVAGFGYAQTDYDYIPDVPDSLIEQRLKAIEGHIPLQYNKEVKRYIHYFTVQNRDWTRRALERSTRYFPLFEEYLRHYNMPDELKYLAVIESGLNPSAVSRASAVGLWQFMYMTGRMYNMEATWYIDDRMDPYKSTDAACRFLSYLHGYFDDWMLALAAYNCGAGRVNKAVRKVGEAGKSDFYTIYPHLPAETRSYVPKFVAMMYTFKYAQEHNLYPRVNMHLPEYDTIQVNQYLHLETLASHTGLCLEDLLTLNPQIRRGAIPDGKKNYPLRVPVDVKEHIVSNRKFLLDTASKVGKADLAKLASTETGSVAGRNKVVHTVRSGEVLGSIAAKYRVRVADIQQWNNLRGTTIRVGQKLNVWVRGEGAPTTTIGSPAVANNTPKPAPVIEPGSGALVYTVQPGDTLWSISKNNNVSVEAIKSLNNMQSDNIKAGQALIIKAK